MIKIDKRIIFLITLPFFILFIFLLPKFYPIEISDPERISLYLLDDYSLSIYSDSYPYNGKLSTIQKGLILENSSFELVGEGVGFGNPILLINDTLILSNKSEITKISQNHIKKTFFLNVIDISTDFVAKYLLIDDFGTIIINYIKINDTSIKINIEPNITKTVDYLIIGNELSSNFSIYRDSEGYFLNSIPIWNGTLAEKTCFSDTNIEFCVHSDLKEKYFGRELRGSYLDWAGVSLFLNQIMKFEFLVTFTFF
ncbi:MAG: hypothetical protein HeimC3_51930 [Candidatus Heimdallarchaeota archaeon LC_3]|nr:MAG: hypothetical protein HeimC3_51930 [Candidatus Heimdallarchaeota archaeon LC_3]